MLLIDSRNPAIVRLQGFSPDELDQAKRFLKYHDRSAEFIYQKFRHARWFLEKNGEEAFKEELARLKQAIQRCIVFEDEESAWTYSGLADQLHVRFPNHEVVNQVEYPEPNSIPWRKVPVHKARKYQVDSVELMLEKKHASGEWATGLGKTRMILDICRQLGLKTVVMAPSLSIADNLYRNFTEHLGEKYVGFVGDGKKKLGKLITIGIFASLAKLEPDSKGWDDLSQAQVFIVDESHMTPASTLEKVCMGLCAKAPYRFFFSATQLRSDGAEQVLKGITGPIVYSMPFQQGVAEGFLASPKFKMIRMKSRSTFKHRDANEMTRAHLYYNPDICKRAGQLADAAVSRLGHQVLILVQEVEQFSMLLPYLHHEVGFAHGGVTKDNRDKVPQAYWDSDPVALVKRFNEGTLPILVGTSCISTGTDILTPQTGINLQGQSSEIKTKQAVGRMTRLHGDKKEFYWFDFMPVLPGDEADGRNQSPPYRHAIIRQGFYTDLFDDFEVL